MRPGSYKWLAGGLGILLLCVAGAARGPVCGPCACPCVCPCPCAAGSVDTDVVAPYVEVRVPGEYGTAIGSGTVIHVGGEVLVLTAGHVVADAQRHPGPRYVDPKTGKEVRGAAGLPLVYLYQQSKGRKSLRKAYVVWYSPDEEDGGNDLALLKPVDATGLHPAVVACNPKLERGEDCYYIGSGSGVYGSLEKSILADVDREGSCGTYTMVNGCAWYGHSGGGLYVKRCGRWQLCGVIVRAAAPDSPKSPGYAQTPQTVARFLAAYRSACRSCKCDKSGCRSPRCPR